MPKKTSRPPVPSPSQPAVVTPDIDLDRMFEEFMEMHRQEPYTFSWMLAELGDLAMKVGTEINLPPQISTDMNSLFYHLHQFFREELARGMVADATLAWGVMKLELRDPELVHAHGLLCAVYSTAFHTKDGIRKLEEWATGSVMVTESTGTGLHITAEHRASCFGLASNAVSHAKRMSSVLRAVAIADNSRIVALLEIVSQNPRLIIPPY